MRGVLGAVGALLLGLAFVPPASSQTPARLQSCHDGDTCTFRGLRDTAVRVRLAGIDTPEMDGNCQPTARRARRVLQRRLRSASKVRVESVEIGRYGRIIGRVYADTLDVSRWLRRRGLAVEYGRPTCVSPARRKRDLSPRNLPYDPDGPDRDCGDFDSQPVAQRFFRAGGGPEEDPHRLDGDDDGIPCESLPGGIHAR